MSRKKRSINNRSMGADLSTPLDRLESMSIQDLNLMAQAAPLALQNRLEKALRSENVEDVLKAQAFISQQEKSGKAVKPDIKSILWNPSEIGFNGRGYRDPNNGIPFTTLQRMGDIYIIKAIINTRIEQIQNFLRYSDDDQKPGFQIRYKKVVGADVNEISRKDMKIVEGLVRFLEDGGENDKWSSEDNFQDFTRKTIKDSLCLDQLCFEVVRSRSMKVNKFRAVDASLIRQLDTDDPRYASMFESYRWHGYLPRYAMVYDSQIIRNPANDELVVYYPWELGYGIRNKTTNVFRNGYGCSELETLIEVVTWILWGMQYNGNFFKQGSQPKGFINVKNSNIDQGTLNEFRQDWKQTMSSVYNAHKIPVIQGIDLEWIDLQQSNKDMEFTEWIKFLFVVTCAVYRIDPSELGFQFQDAARVFGQDGQKERLDHSQKKGLFPLLIFFQNIVNRYIISEIDDRFEFVFTGVDVKDESSQVDLDKRKLDAGVVSLEDMFRKYSGRDLDPEKDTILNSIYQTAQTNKMMGGEGMNNTVDEMNGEGGNGGNGDFDIADMLMQKSQGNPILGKALEFIDNQLSAK